MNAKEFFVENGYFVISETGIDSEVCRLEISELIKNIGVETNILEIDNILKSNLWKLQFNPILISTCRSIFGDFGYINDFNLQFNLVDNKGPMKGWHIDCGSELRDDNYDYLFTRTIVSPK